MRQDNNQVSMPPANQIHKYREPIIVTFLCSLTFRWLVCSFSFTELSNFSPWIFMGTCDHATSKHIPCTAADLGHCRHGTVPESSHHPVLSQCRRNHLCLWHHTIENLWKYWDLARWGETVLWWTGGGPDGSGWQQAGPGNGEKDPTWRGTENGW